MKKFTKLQIILGVITIILALFTVVTAILYLTGSIADVGICVIGSMICGVVNCLLCVVSTLNIKNKNF
jgi:hypothetical protein